MKLYILFIYLYYIPIYNGEVTSDLPEVSLHPKKNFYELGELVTISCRMKNVNPRNFMYKRLGSMMMYQCKTMTKLDFTFSCGKEQEYYYINATVRSLTWAHHGEYGCTDNVHIVNVTIPISVRPKLSLELSRVIRQPQKTSDKQQKQTAPPRYIGRVATVAEETNVTGDGSRTNPYSLLRSDLVKAVQLTCHSSCASPMVFFKWQLLATDFSGSVDVGARPLQTLNGGHASKSSCGNDTFQATSDFLIDCQTSVNPPGKAGIFGLHVLRCSTNNEPVLPNINTDAYFLCPDIHTHKRSATLAKLASIPVTVGEVVNIVIGCSIGVVMLVVGIVLICRHRHKDLLLPGDHGNSTSGNNDRYMMRQDLMDHQAGLGGGYRV